MRTNNNVRAVGIPLPVLNSNEAIVNYVCANWNSAVNEYESCYIAYLDHNNKLIKWELFNTGDATAVDIDVSKILRTAVSLDAKGLVFAHNHPGGNTQPSHADITTTELIYKGCEILRIKFVDHIIVSTKDGPYSFAQSKILNTYRDNIEKANAIVVKGTFTNIALSIVENFCLKSKKEGTTDYAIRTATLQLLKVYTKFYDPII